MFGSIVVPGVVYVEMALEAVRALLGHGERGERLQLLLSTQIQIQIQQLYHVGWTNFAVNLGFQNRCTIVFLVLNA